VITKKVYIVFTIILSLLSVAAGVYLVQRNQNPLKKAEVSSVCIECRTSLPDMCDLYSATPQFNAMVGRYCGSSTCDFYDACAPHVRSGQSCGGRYTDIDSPLRQLSGGEANHGKFVGCNANDQSQNCFCNGFEVSDQVSCYSDENGDSCAARKTYESPTTVPTTIPTNTPTPIPTATPTPYDITWVINSHVTCPDGSQLTGKTRNYYAYWPPNPLTWQYNSFSVGDKTVTATLSSNTTSNVYLGMETETETSLDIKGTSPNSHMTFAKYFNPPTMMAKWDENLPAGTYEITFLGNTEVCTIVNSPTPTPTCTPNPTSTPTNSPAPTNTPVPTNTSTPTQTPTGTLTPTKIPTSTSTPTGTPNPSSTPTTTLSPTSTSRPSAPTATPTVIVLPQSGIEFPTQGLTIIGIIVTLIGFLVLL
jgi:hypothetical protein